MSTTNASPERPTYKKDLDEAIVELRRPFTPEAIRVKPLTKKGNDGKSSAAFYIDSRLVVQRFNAVVGPAGWTDEYTPLGARGSDSPSLNFPVQCSLTVLGVTKQDVGQLGSSKVDDKCWKSAYSDALKRAAVKFEVGAFLYVIGRLRAPVNERDGKVTGFTEDGHAQLMSAYDRWLNRDDLNIFGEPLDHGDIDFASDQARETFWTGGEEPEDEGIAFAPHLADAGGYQ